ncbi:MAG: type II secretion system major pseudopilin GspG [Bacteriovoracia bacterium]
MKTKRKRNQGFTLIEILIVMTLLGLIASFAVTNVISRQQEGYRKGTKITMQQIRTNLDDYFRTCNSYPTNAQGGLETLLVKPADNSCPNYPPEGFLQSKQVPKDAWGNDFIYVCDDGRKYVLKSLGRDRREGGEGHDKDISTEDPDF